MRSNFTIPAGAILTFAGVLTGFARTACAQAGLLSDFEDGYGIVAAEVVEATRIPVKSEYPDTYETTFKVHAVAAQPIKGEPFTLQSGDRLKIRLTVGYKCQIEFDLKSAFAKGACYYLIVRRNDEGTFEHLEGGSVMLRVKAIDANERQYYAKVRGLVIGPEATRLAAWINAVKNPLESDRFRSDALCGIEAKPFSGGVEAGDDARNALRRVWNDPKSHLSTGLLNQLDRVLRNFGHGFPSSDNRRDVWLKSLFALPPEQTKNDSDVDQSARYVLPDLAKIDPEGVGPRLAAELSNKKWPIAFRSEIAYALSEAYRHSERPDDGWARALNGYFAGLMKDGEWYAVRSAAGELESLAGINPPPWQTGIRRNYVPDAETMTALREGADRLRTAAGRPGADQELALAANELSRVIIALDARDEP